MRGPAGPRARHGKDPCFCLGPDTPPLEASARCRAAGSGFELVSSPGASGASESSLPQVPQEPVERCWNGNARGRLQCPRRTVGIPGFPAGPRSRTAATDAQLRYPAPLPADGRSSVPARHRRDRLSERHALLRQLSPTQSTSLRRNSSAVKAKPGIKAERCRRARPRRPHAPSRRATQCAAPPVRWCPMAGTGASPPSPSLAAAVRIDGVPCCAFQPWGARLSPEHGVPVEQRPALHRGRRTSQHRVCAPACVEARPGGVAHPARGGRVGGGPPA